MSTAALAAPTIGERINSRHLKGLLLGLLSVAIIISHSYQAGIQSIALVLPFIAMLSITLGTVLHSRWEISQQRSGGKCTPLLLVLLVQVTGALMVFMPGAAVTDNLHWNFSATQWGTILWLALAVSLGAYAVLLLLLRHMSAICVSSLTYLVPPATMLQAYLVLNEPLSVSSMLALGVASAAVYLIVTPSPALSPSSSITSASSDPNISAGLARQTLRKMK